MPGLSIPFNRWTPGATENLSTQTLVKIQQSQDSNPSLTSKAFSFPGIRDGHVSATCTTSLDSWLPVHRAEPGF